MSKEHAINVSNTNAKPVSREALLEQCRDLAESGSVLYELKNALHKFGFVGSTDIPELVVLTAITRKFRRPVSLVVKGATSVGKSFALRAGLCFVPSTAYQRAF
jgi:hypothetical protein